MRMTFLPLFLAPKNKQFHLNKAPLFDNPNTVALGGDGYPESSYVGALNAMIDSGYYSKISTLVATSSATLVAGAYAVNMSPDELFDKIATTDKGIYESALIGTRGFRHLIDVNKDPSSRLLSHFINGLFVNKVLEFFQGQTYLVNEEVSAIIERYHQGSATVTFEDLGVLAKASPQNYKNLAIYGSVDFTEVTRFDSTSYPNMSIVDGCLLGHGIPGWAITKNKSWMSLNQQRLLQNIRYLSDEEPMAKTLRSIYYIVTMKDLLRKKLYMGSVFTQGLNQFYHQVLREYYHHLGDDSLGIGLSSSYNAQYKSIILKIMEDMDSPEGRALVNTAQSLVESHQKTNIISKYMVFKGKVGLFKPSEESLNNNNQTVSTHFRLSKS